MTITPSRLLAILLSIGALVLVFGLWQGSMPKESSTPTVAATIFPIYDLTQRIAGNDVGVELILSPGASPHTFEPTPSDVARLSNAQVVYTIGNNLDTWADTIIDATGAENVRLDQGITLRENTEEEEHEHEHEDDHDHEDGPTDPHYWLNGENGIIMTATIERDLSERFPQYATAFHERAESLRAEITSTNTTIQSLLATRTNTNIVTFHDAWYYFADAYGLKVAGTFEPSAGREPTPAVLVELTRTVRNAKVHTIFTEPQFSTAGIASFAKDNNITIATIDPIGGTPSMASYTHLLLTNAQIIAQNE